MDDSDPPAAPSADETPPPTRGARGFRRLALVVLASLGLLLCVAGGTAVGLYLSATAAVPEYEAAVAVDPAVAEAQRRELESRLAALVSATQAEPAWTSRVTADQVNAWLALRLERDFPGFPRAGLSAPRVLFGEGTATFAARSAMGRLEGVLSVTLRPEVTETGELALRIESAKIGRLSLPLEAILGQLRQTPLGEGGPVRLASTEAGGAVLVDLERLEGADGVRITGVNVRPGELLLRGEGGADARVEP